MNPAPLAGLRNLLVAFNGSEASVAALRLALTLARASDAHVTGLLAHGTSLVSGAIPAWFSDTLRRSILETLGERARVIRQGFADQTRDRLPPDRLHWLEIGGDPDRTVADYARLYDLTVIGQQTAATAEELILHPGRIGEASGRPVLVVPAGAETAALPAQALIAWDGMRAATGAVAAALPLLGAAQRITALTVDTGRTGQPLEGIDLPEMLRRHGLACDWHHIPPGKGGTAATILDHARRIGAGLIVLGLPSHGDIGRMIAGSVTPALLEGATTPLFLSR